MLILYGMFAVYAVLGIVIVVLIYRLTRMKEAVFAARLSSSRAQAHQDAAKRAAQAAEEKCMRALGQVEKSLAQTGQALEVAGQIELVSQQIHGLIEYIAHPQDAPPQLPHKPGRHALQASTGPHAITSNAEPEFTP